MLKKQKRKHLRQKDKSSHDGADGAFRLMPHPLAGMDPAEMKAALLAFAQKQSEEFPKLLDGAFDLLKRKYPPLLIAIVAFYSLQAGVTDAGEIQPFNPDTMQHHVEVLQALALTMTEDEWGKAFAGWSLATTDVLRSAVYAEQLNIEKALVRLKATVERNRDNPLKECCLAVHSHPLGDNALLFLGYPPELTAKRRDLAGEMAAQVLDGRADLNRVVVISRDTSRWDEPYASVFFMNRPKTPAA